MLVDHHYKIKPQMCRLRSAKNHSQYKHDALQFRYQDLPPYTGKR